MEERNYGSIFTTYIVLLILANNTPPAPPPKKTLRCLPCVRKKTRFLAL